MLAEVRTGTDGAVHTPWCGCPYLTTPAVAFVPLKPLNVERRGRHTSHRVRRRPDGSPPRLVVRDGPILSKSSGVSCAMTIRRVVPNLLCSAIETTRDFYVHVLGFEVVMDMGWIVTVASPSNPTAQISFFQGDPGPASDEPVLTIEVREVDAVHATVTEVGSEVVLSLRDEPWGVRRFFTRDPDGRVVNVMSQPDVVV
jgi:catechol 2,3-dioxygenase-like lactoylglutathione lyase family enzyme